MSPGSAPDADELRFWLALHRAPLIGSRRFRAILDRYGSPRAFFASDRCEWRAAGLPERTMAYLDSPDWKSVDGDLEWLTAQDRSCLTLADPHYPSLLKEIADPPALLFVRGEPAVLGRRHMAVVGTRNPTPVGRRTAHEFAKALIEAGFGVVSGLAQGIDAASHRGALDGDGITVGVAGTGLDQVYPSRHEALAEEMIARGGALVSEYSPGIVPKAGNFPRRNRIISGLSFGTLVVEAAPLSGSLITARLAVEQGREVFAVPGSIHNPLARGCNDLIKQGAKLVQTVDDILEEFEFRLPKRALDEPNHAELAGEAPHLRLLKFVAYDPTSVDTLVTATGISPESISSTLLLLELEGYVASAPGGGYIRIK